MPRSSIDPRFRGARGDGTVDKLRFVRVGTLDSPGAVPPTMHIFTRSKLPWVILPEGVPAVAAYFDINELWPAASLERRRRALSDS